MFLLNLLFNRKLVENAVEKNQRVDAHPSVPLQAVDLVAKDVVWAALGPPGIIASAIPKIIQSQHNEQPTTVTNKPAPNRDSDSLL